MNNIHVYCAGLGLKCSTELFHKLSCSLYYSITLSHILSDLPVINFHVYIFLLQVYNNSWYYQKYILPISIEE